MTRLEALQALAQKVEAGTAEFDWTAEYWPRDGGFWLPAHSCEAAYHGSLDAAKALHESVLHERVSKSETWSKRYGGTVVIRDMNCILGQGSDVNGNPARAWLLAILKALIAALQAKGNE